MSLNKVAIISSPDETLQNWLHAVGLHFNPFSLLEASTDSHLSAYLIGHDAFSIAWNESPSLMFAPAGGGKTALRMRVLQACWMGQETNRPFPISYVPPYLYWGHLSPSLEDHLIAINHSGALHLLLLLAYRPHWFLRLEKEDRRTIRQALDWNLPGSIHDFLSPCQNKKNILPLNTHFSPASLPPDPSDADALLKFIHSIEQTPSSAALISLSPAERWKALTEAIINILHFPAIYLLVDGLDSISETAENPEIAMQTLSPLLNEVFEWSEQRIFVKTFIPVETREIVERKYPHILQKAHSINLEWTPPLLAEVIRRRVYVASQGAYGSLGAISSPMLRDIEFQLAKEVYPLPREMLVLTQAVIESAALCHSEDPIIQEEDIAAALKWYRHHSVIKTTNN